MTVETRNGPTGPGLSPDEGMLSDVSFTQRQLDVLRCLAEGLNEQGIAESVRRSYSNVSSQKEEITEIITQRIVRHPLYVEIPDKFINKLALAVAISVGNGYIDAHNLSAGPSEPLTGREENILKLMIMGINYEGISELLCISKDKVTMDVDGISRKTDSYGRARRYKLVAWGVGYFKQQAAPLV